MSDAEQLLARTPDAEALQRTLSKIGELDLKDNLIELETKGYTTVKGVLSEDKIERAKRAILKRVANRGNPESGESGDSVLNSLSSGGYRPWLDAFITPFVELNLS